MKNRAVIFIAASFIFLLIGIIFYLKESKIYPEDIQISVSIENAGNRLKSGEMAKARIDFENRTNMPIEIPFWVYANHQAYKSGGIDVKFQDVNSLVMISPSSNELNLEDMVSSWTKNVSLSPKSSNSIFYNFKIWVNPGKYNIRFIINNSLSRETFQAQGIFKKQVRLKKEILLKNVEVIDSLKKTISQ